MKKIVLFLLFFLLIYYLFITNNNQCKNRSARIYKINDKNYCLLIGSSRTEWERGLMFYKKPVDFDGMIFIFPDKDYRTFWNKNTYLDLDVYWLNDDKVVGKSFLPSILKSKKVVTVGSGEEVNRVVEIIF